jgi:Ca2+-binding EF-hand superfamily protein
MESPLHKEKLNETFKKADLNGSGKLTFSQIKCLMKTLIVNNKYIDFKDTAFDLVCKMADLNGDKLIDYEELYNLLHGDKLEEEDFVKIAFRAYDTNSDGYIDMKELEEVLKLSGKDYDPDEIKLAIAVFNQNNEGKLNYNVFSDRVDGKIKRSSCWYLCFICCKK